ncbi:hypothetical protein LCGC14_2110760, partial [marine sediment metagenome]
TSGVFEFDCDGAAYELGNFVAPGQAFTEEVEDGLCNQQIAPVAEPQCAIARINKHAPSGATSVLIGICSTVMSGGVDGTTTYAKSPA